MPRKNILSLPEAIAVAPLNNKKREATFNEVASFIEQRDLYLERNGIWKLRRQLILKLSSPSHFVPRRLATSPYWH
jgi:hypothetical protein